MKQKKSTFDEEQKGLFLVDKCGKDRIVAIATGPIYAKGDPRMTADKTYHIDVPAAAGMAGNQVMDCTNSKVDMGHLMVKNHTSAASTCKVVLSESKTYLVFLATQDFKKNDEMIYSDTNQQPKPPDNGLNTK